MSGDTDARRPRGAPAALLPTGVVLGLLVLVWAATTGPVGMLHESGRHHPFVSPPPSAATALDVSPAPNLREVTRNVKPVADLSWLGNLIAIAFLVGALVALNLLVRRAWARRWRPPETPPDLDFDVMPDRVRAALQQDAAAQLDAVAQGSPRNGIVACWLRLQEALAAAGVRSERAETAAELVVRALKSLDLDPRAIGELAGLYREARFSEHDLGEDERARARAALAVLHHDLDARQAPA